MKTLRLILLFVLLTVLFAAIGAGSAGACGSSGPPTVTTDLADYGPLDTALISGSGFGCGATLTVRVTAPNGAIITGDGSGTPGSDVVNTDGNGEFILNYALSGSGPGGAYFGQEGVYTVEVLDGTAVIAYTTFTDSHFRYFSLAWTRGSGNTVNFSGTSVWRTSPGVWLDTGAFSPGSGPRVNFPNTFVTSGSDLTGTFQVYTHAASYTYPNEGPFEALYTSCCRISTLANAADDFWREEVTIDLRGGNTGGPTSNLPSVVQLVEIQPGSIQIPTGDPDNDPVSCRLSTFAESQITSIPAGLAVSPSCELTWTPPAGSLNKLYAVQVMLESTHAGHVSSTPLDFMIQIVGGAPPTCQLNGIVNNNLTVGTPFSISTTGTDPDGQNLTVTHFGLPAGATLTPASGTTGASPLGATFNWTPGPGAAGSSQSVTIRYTDPNGLNDDCSFSMTLPSNQAPSADAGGPYNGSEGQPIAINSASASDAEDPISILWSVDNSTLCSFNDATIINPTLTCDDDGVYTATLSVDDGVNLAVTSDATINVGNLDPSVSANSASVTVDEGQTANNSGTYGDVPADTVSLSVDVGAITDLGGGTWGWSFNSSDGPSESQLVTVTAQDEDGGSSTASFNLVVDNVNPTVTLSGPVAANEGDTKSYNFSTSDPGDEVFSIVSVSCGPSGTASGQTINPATGAGSFDCSFADDVGSGTATDSSLVQVTVADGDGGSDDDDVNVTVSNVDPVIDTFIAPVAPQEINTAVSASATYSDVGVLDTHSASLSWGDSTTTTPTAAGGSISDSHAYSTPGIYTLMLTLTDDDTGQDIEYIRYVVVYDPDDGFVTGGGWIDSPAGAYTADPDLTGRANFGFVAKYKKGQSTPDGNTEFQFKAGDINFHSSVYEWLVVAGHKAQFKGAGTINGAGNFGFMITATDENLTPSVDTDRFRIKIWDIANGNQVVYDNQVGAADDAEATMDIGAGSIVIHTRGKK